MMRSIYSQPLKVYLIIGLLAIWGILSSITLPVSLFPNSSRPVIRVQIPYGNLTANEFQKSYGNRIESQVSALIVNEKQADSVEAEYQSNMAFISIHFPWGTNGRLALNEVERLLASISNAWPEESKKQYSVRSRNNNSGFLAVSFYSSKRSLEELYTILEPFVSIINSSAPDSSGVNLWNPNQKIVEVYLDPEKMAVFKLLPSDIEAAIKNASNSLSGGNISMGQKSITIEMPRQLNSLENLRTLPILNRSGTRLQLRDIAEIHHKIDEHTARSFRTSGVTSLILFSSAKPDGNIKKMSDNILQEIDRLKMQLPDDIEYKALVNPSEFIDASIKSVSREVLFASLLAVFVLLFFIGSLKNVITAAIEIPLSIIMAFIFMKIFDVNINLISLGGLALSAGMNVDASVVVMENIFRHFSLEKNKLLSAQDKIEITIKAVKEVWLPIIASTIASLVVFLPLVMTSGLTNAILGDLAKAVIFSHGMSAVVALILVPTIRLQMMKSETTLHLKSPIDKLFSIAEYKYANLLKILIEVRNLRLLLYSLISLVLILSITVLLPRLKAEIIGRPDTDWIVVGFNGNVFSDIKKIENFTEKLEFELLKEFDNKITYTFTEMANNYGQVMLRLKNKNDMNIIWKKLDEKYADTPDVSYWVEPWNPSELPIPDPEHVRLEIRGGTKEERELAANEIRVDTLESKAFPRVKTLPQRGQTDQITLTPNSDIIAQNENMGINLNEIANYVRISTSSKNIGQLTIDNRNFDVLLKTKPERVKTVEDIMSLPINLDTKIAPLSALAQVELKTRPPEIFRLNQSELSLLIARENESDNVNIEEKQSTVKNVITRWQERNKGNPVKILWTEPNKDMKESLKQLSIALLLSIILIFMTMILQFGNIVSALLVLVAIPLGFIGVIISLYIFNSTLSLNSALGTILLSGISVANSIILVDFINKLIRSGAHPTHAAIEAAKVRLKPIIMTSLTTILGMTPIALGMGEGGKILQPLGIAVAGGLWVSMLLTLLVVPILQANYFNWKNKNIESNVIKSTFNHRFFSESDMNL